MTTINRSLRNNAKVIYSNVLIRNVLLLYVKNKNWQKKVQRQVKNYR